MKRLLSLFLAMLLLFSVVPLNAFAAEGLTVETEAAESIDLPVEDEADSVDLPVEDEADPIDLPVEEETEPVNLPIEEESEFPVLLDSSNVTLTGTISLPNGGTAPSKTYFSVSYQTDDVSDYYRGSFEAGATSADWTITLPADSVVQYLIISISNPHLLGVLPQYRCLSNGFVAGGSESQPMTISELEACNLDLTLTPGTPMQIDISLPKGYEVAADGFSVEAFVQFEDNDIWEASWGSAQFKAGQTESTCYVMLPISDTMVIRRITLEVYDAPGLISELYYQADGTWSTEYPTLSFSLNEVAHLMATLQAFDAVTLSGTVMLPEGQTAPAAGLRGYVQCWLADSTKYKKDFTIAAGQNAQSWTLDMPADAEVSRLRFWIYEPQLANVLPQYYYNGSGYSLSYVNNLGLTTDELAARELDLVLTPGTPMQVDVSLPDGYEVTGDGFEVDASVYVKDNGKGTTYSGSAWFEAGETETTCYVMLPVSDSMVIQRITLYVYEAAGLLSELYYQKDGTWSSEYSNLSCSLDDVAHLTATLQTSSTITGTVTLPAGTVLNGNTVHGYVSAITADGDYYDSDTLEFSADSTTAAFTINVPVGTNQYRVSLHLTQADGTNLVSSAVYYVGSGVMSTDSNDAAWIATGSSDLELTAMLGESLSGTLSFAEGSAFTLAEGSSYARAWIYATSNTDGATYSTNVQFTAPGTYNWTMNVPDDANGYTLYVNVNGSVFETSNICSNVDLYYSADGTLGSEANAATVNPGDTPNLVIPLQQTIPLTLSFPEGTWIKNGSIRLYVSAGLVGSSSTSVSSTSTISDPSQPVHMELAVPNEGDYWIRIGIYPVTNVETGVRAETNLRTNSTLYWSESGWVSDRALATAVSTDGAALTLPLADGIPLRIVLGEGAILEGNYDLTVCFTNENGSGQSYSFSIDGNAESTTLLDDTIWYTGTDSALQVDFYIRRADTGLHDTNVRTEEYLYLKEDGSFTMNPSESYAFPLETLKSGLTATLPKERTLSGRFVFPDTYVSDGAEHEFSVYLRSELSAYAEYFYVQPDGTFRVVLPSSKYNGLYTATFSPYGDLQGVIKEEIVYADETGEAIPLDLTKSDDITGVSITLRGGTILSGTVILPDDLTYEQNASMRVRLYVQSVEDDSSYYTNITKNFEAAGSGGQKLPFSVSVPMDIGSFRLRYSVSAEDTNLLKGTFYVTADGGYTKNAEEAGVFTTETAPTQITAPTGTKISLQLKLPSGAATGSYDGRVDFYYPDGSLVKDQTTYFSLYNATSSTVTLCLPKDLTQCYLSYNLSNAADSTVLTGKQLYCKADGTLAASLEEADLLDIAQLPAITFGLKADFGKIVQGTISFDEGLTYTSAPGRGYVYFYTPEGSYLGSEYVTFNSSSKSYSYSHFFDQDDLTGVIVEFYLNSTGNANIKSGNYYYSDGGVVGSIGDATAVPLDTNPTVVNFVIPTLSTKLTGKLTAAADSAYAPVVTGTRSSVTINLTSESGATKYLSASLDENLSFSINIPTETCGTYTRASIYLDTSGVDNIRPGTYSYASSFTLTENETTDLEIPVKFGMPVYVDISRPEGTTASERFTLYFDSAQDSISCDVNISSGQTTASQVLIPLTADVGYEVSLNQYSSRHDNVCELYCGMLYLTEDDALTIFSDNATARTFQSGEHLALTAVAPAASIFQFTDVDEYTYGSVYAETVDGLYTNSSSLNISANSSAFYSDVIPPDMIGEDLLIAYSLNALGNQKIYINPDGSYTLDRSKAVSHRIQEENYFRIGVLKDTTDPTASISNGSALQSTINYNIRFDASASTDNFGIESYAWDFGDGYTGWGSTATHAYSESGDYTVTLTVTDYSGNTDTATIQVTILSPDDGSVAAFSVKDTTTTAAISDAQITVTADSGKQFHLRTDSSGEVYLALEPGDYTVQAAASSYEPRTFRFTKVADQKQAFTIYMNSSDLLDITTTVKEMTLEEIEDAGIDTENPANQHVYECIAVFEFGPVVYHYNGAGEVVGNTTAPDGIEVVPVAKDVYLVVKSETRWLKEMFQVSLIVNNTSAVERIEGLTANLELPDGLSLAAMLPGYAPQTNEVVIGAVEPQASSQTDWYLCGDAEGTYYLDGSVTGVRVGGGIREDIEANFRTKDPIVVLAGSAMQLTIEAERYATVGTPYKLRYTLENVSGKTLYNVSLNVLGGKFYNEFPYTALEYLPDEGLGGTYSPDDGVLSVEEFKPGDVLSGMFTITFAEGIETDYIDYMLERFFSLTGNGSTTTIPTIIRYFHNWDEGTVVTAPTCTEKGVKRYTCLDEGCGETKDEPIPALGHDYRSVVTDPTCTEQGYTTHTCSRCGDSYVDTYVNALGHDYESVVTDPTCTEQGYTTYTCQREGCNYSYVGDYVDALGHDYQVDVTEPTCTEQGYTTYTCQREGCNYSYVGDYVDALGHDYQVDVTEPTCTEQGYTTYTCQREGCAHSYIGDYVDALGHDYQSVVTDPTCTEKGYTTHTCSRCADSYQDTEVAALGHDYQSVVTDPTCTEPGYTTHTCSRCADSYQDTEVAALGHDYQSVVTDPTCTEPGYTTHTCTRCNDSYQDTEVAALGHDWSDWVVTVHPTLEQEGTRTRTCRRTGCGMSETESMPKLQSQNIWTIDLTKYYGDADATSMCKNQSEGGGALTYRSSDEKVVTVTPTAPLGGCKMEFTGVGTATITVTAAAVEDVYVETEATFTVTVNKAKNPLVIKANDVNLTYGDAVPVAPGYIVVSGLVNGDTTAVLNGSAVYDISYRQFQNVGDGSYSIAVSGLTAKNYNIEFQLGTLTVAKATDYQIVFDANSLVWNLDLNPTVQVTASPSIRDDTATIQVEYQVNDEWTTTAPAADGTYNVRAHLVSSENLVVPEQPVYVTDTLTLRAGSSFINTGNKDYQVDVTEQEGGRVEIAVTDEEVQEIVNNITTEDGSVTMDMTGNGVASGKDGLTISGNLVEGLSESEDVESFEVKTQDAEITMDKNALDTIANALQSDEDTDTKLTIQMSTVDTSDLNEDQQDALAAIGGGDVVVLDLQLQVTTFDKDGNPQGDATNIHELGGVVEIRVAYDQPVDENTMLVALYVNDKGETTYLPVVYKDGFVHFVTDHFSVYALKKRPAMEVSVEKQDTALAVTIGNASSMTEQAAMIAAYDADGRMITCVTDTITPDDSNEYHTTLNDCADAAAVKVFVVDAKSAPMMEPIYWEK